MKPEIVPIRRIDHVRFFVGNARQSAYFYRNAFGFDVVNQCTARNTGHA